MKPINELQTFMILNYPVDVCSKISNSTYAYDKHCPGTPPGGVLSRVELWSFLEFERLSDREIVADQI
ncbi:MAG: hypothetical protein AB9866_15715 [Syntrophobacteraceae bacterium]